MKEASHVLASIFYLETHPRTFQNQQTWNGVVFIPLPSTSTHLLFMLVYCLEPWNYSALWQTLAQPPSEACWAPKCDKKLIKMIWALRQPQWKNVQLNRYHLSLKVSTSLFCPGLSTVSCCFCGAAHVWTDHCSQDLGWLFMQWSLYEKQFQLWVFCFVLLKKKKKRIKDW